MVSDVWLSYNNLRGKAELQWSDNLLGVLLSKKGSRDNDLDDSCLFVGCLLNVPATRKCISGTDLLRQFYVLPH